MPHDDLEHIPSIVATRDGQPERGTSRARAGKGEGGRQSGPQKQASGAGGAGLLARFFIGISLIAVVALCVWAWTLQAQLLQADDQIANYASRIGDLEARLSDTDEGMNQNAEVQAVKIAELEKEVRKLWDNVWKESRERLVKLEDASASQDKSIKSVQGTLSSAQSQFKEASDDIAELKGISGDLTRLIASGKTNQAEVERVADKLNQINLTLAKLERRVADNEEWVASINVFRKQVNSSLSQLQAAIRAQSAP